MQSNNEYSNGLLKSILRTKYMVEAKILKIKSEPLKPNTPRQITNSGKLKAYNQVISYLKAQEDSINRYIKSDGLTST